MVLQYHLFKECLLSAKLGSNSEYSLGQRKLNPSIWEAKPDRGLRDAGGFLWKVMALPGSRYEPLALSPTLPHIPSPSFLSFPTCSPCGKSVVVRTAQDLGPHDVS